MTKELNEVKLLQINLELSFRNDRGIELKFDINSNDLMGTLLDEEKSHSEVALNEGFDGYQTLEEIGKGKTSDLVNLPSSEVIRIVQILKREIPTLIMTGNGLKRFMLLPSEKDRKPIPSVDPTKTIDKTTPTVTVINSEGKKKEDKKNRGETGKTEIAREIISKSKLADNTKAYFLAKEELKVATSRLVYKVSKEQIFRDLHPEQEIKCLDNLIENQAKNYQSLVNTILTKYSLSSKYNEEKHTIIHNQAFEYLETIKNIFSINNYLDYLSLEQKKHLETYLQELQLILNPQISDDD